MIRLTSSPATLPASLVAWRWSSLKYAGTVITALSTVSPRYASASALSFWRIIAEISGGEYVLSPASTRASPLGPEATLYGTICSSSRTSASLRPMKRLIEKTVFSGFVTACRLATVPTSRSPLLAKAATGGGAGAGAGEPLAALGEGDDGRGGATTLGVLDDGGLTALEHRHARVRRAEVDADGLAHVVRGSCLRGGVSLLRLS